ncbi:MAG: CPBP family intramembrane metalloprotease [Devosia sp.]|uniref:CPBP family glutamic-type intramembrane protease n=1 Tax=Devosia sp. TaxID=1871048 RepID=UPI001A3D070C|nr:CPBP family glutamic-type intramembrane protease [Devosia sp.]MBL8598807.1 CPBP family intramembrane metalloprotease [Devosia sp.]
MRQTPDFPFYNGQPTSISGPGWLLVIASTGLAFYLLTGPVLTVLPGLLAAYSAAILFAGLPLLALHLVSKGHGTAVFHRYGIKSLGISLGFAVLTIATSAAVAFVLSRVFTFTANPSGDALAGTDGWGLAIFLSRTFFQLIGEEVVTILPLLAVLWFCVQKLNLSKGLALTIAVIMSTAWFAAMHLPTYDWNYLQCFGIIGTARLVLTAAYLLTRNLGVSAGAHIINDWSIFIFTFVGSHAPIEA